MDQSAQPDPPRKLPLSSLRFDLDNPRYGNRAGEVKGEIQALDLIVSDFLVDDLLSSISTNGFFEGEPLIAKELKDGEYEILEGNRRLASLLILANDPRAINQAKRHEIFSKKMKENGHDVPGEVPVILVQNDQQVHAVLAYLGTKHIVGPSEWDSYAKAKWMARMRDETGLPLDRIKEMIGDVGGLVNRMLEGYYVIEQIRRAALFSSEQSYVRGRGSNPDFPFSWIYTALGYAGVRRFLGITEIKEPTKDPVPPASLENAGDILRMMFGDRSEERPPVIEESRDLAALSRALANPAKVARLREGVMLDVVEEESRPPAERLASLIQEARKNLNVANGILAEGVAVADLTDLQVPSRQAFAAARTLRDSIKKTIEEAQAAEDEDDGGDDNG